MTNAGSLTDAFHNLEQGNIKVLIIQNTTKIDYNRYNPLPASVDCVINFMSSQSAFNYVARIQRRASSSTIYKGIVITLSSQEGLGY